MVKLPAAQAVAVVLHGRSESRANSVAKEIEMEAVLGGHGNESVKLARTNIFR